MKKTFYLMIMVAVFLSCTNNNSEKEVTELNGNEKSSFHDFIGSTVAYNKDGKVKLSVSNSNLLSSFNKYAKDNKLNLKAISHEILEIDGNFYLRFSNEDDSVSTVALLNSNKNSKTSTKNQEQMIAGGTVCTRTKCANCCGCIPSGDYCTRCEVDVLSCERTTSG